MAGGRNVRCTACSWAGFRYFGGGVLVEPCPECDAKVVFAEQRCHHTRAAVLQTAPRMLQECFRRHLWAPIRQQLGSRASGEGHRWFVQCYRLSEADTQCSVQDPRWSETANGSLVLIGTGQF